MTQNSQFSRFIAVFHELLPIFLGSRRICMPRKNPYLFEIYDKKLVVFSFYGRFHDLLPIVLGFQGDLQRFKTRYMFDSYDQKLVVFVFYVHFHELLPTFFGFLKDLPTLEEPLHVFRDMTRNSSFSRLWPF